MMLRRFVTVVLIGIFCSTGISATYYVDFAGGADANDGLTQAKPFQHAPGDPAAAEKAKAVTLKPGDTVIFKGGVRYEGGVLLKGVSGEKGNPITLDGNTAGTFGKGKAIIDGGQRITGWKPCTPDMAVGNPHAGKLFYVDLPAPRRIDRVKPWMSMNLCGPNGPLSVAQASNPADNIFQEDPKDYTTSDKAIALGCAAKVYPSKGTKNNGGLPLISMFSNVSGPALIEPLPGATINVDVPKPVTITSVGIKPQPRYPVIGEVQFLADGNVICEAKLADPNQNKMQKFDLSKPVTINKTFTLKVIRAAAGEKRNWTKIADVQGYDADGKNVLYFPVEMTMSDPSHLTARDPDAYKGMTLGFHGGHNALIYVPIEGFDPKTRTLKLGLYSGSRYKTTRYNLFNSPTLIDRPGEYSVQPSADGKKLRLVVFPEKLEGREPAELSCTVRTTGIDLQQSSHIRVEGFLVRQQGGRNAYAVNAYGPSEDVLVKDCEISWINGTGVHSSQVNNMVVESCEIHDNPGHTKGVVLRNASGVAIRNTKAYRNTSTAMDFYTCSDGEMKGNVLWDNLGMHANGLTCYVGCKNILIEGNYVRNGNVALTFQQIEGVTVRNNLFDGSGNTTVVGIWPAPPVKDIKILNNTFINGPKDSNWQVGLFTNARNIGGLLVENNIIDGVYSEHNGAGFKNGVFRNNVYTRPPMDNIPKGEDNVVIADMSKLFVNPAKGDYRVNSDGPAKGKGATLPEATWKIINAIPKAEK